MGIFRSCQKNIVRGSGQKVAIDVRAEPGDVRTGAIGRGNCYPLDLRGRLRSQRGKGVDTHTLGKLQAGLLFCLAIAGLGESSALHDRASKIALGEWRGTETQHRACACGLSEDGYIVRITAEVLYIRFHPFQSLQLIEHAVVSGSVKGALAG